MTCLYVSHVQGRNTCRGEQNGFIQTETLALTDRYIYPLAERRCDLHSLRKIDLCGGINPTPGYESVDLHGGWIAADLNERLPFGDGEVGVFRAHEALEHLRAPIHTMKELHRCLAPQGWLLSQTPSTDGRGEFQDPTHVSFWNSNSFWYYARADQNRFIDCPIRFQANRLKSFFPSEWHREHQIVYVKVDPLKVAGRVPRAVAMMQGSRSHDFHDPPSTHNSCCTRRGQTQFRPRVRNGMLGTLASETCFCLQRECHPESDTVFNRT
jgi:SAM-dependent methyltransferase